MKQLAILYSVIILSAVFYANNQFNGAYSNDSNIIKYIAKHVVSYNVIKQNNDRFATGFHVKHNGKVYILTNKHVCDTNRDIYDHDYIQFEDYVGEVIDISTEHDLCLVSSNRKDGLRLSDLAPEALDKVILIGHPRGLGKTVRTGHYVDKVSMYASWLEGSIHEAYNMSFIAYGGNSGSPVCNVFGDVIGVLFAGSPSYHTEAMVVPLEYVRDFLNKQ